MLNFLESITTWHWLILGVLLIAGEALGAAGFMLGIAASAFIISALLALGILHDWQHQLLLFALFSVVSSIVIWKFFRSNHQADDASKINDRASQHIGKRLTLENDILNREGRIQIGDTLWKVEVDQDLEAGCQIEVIGSHGMVLTIRRIT